MVHQHFMLVPSFTVAQNIVMSREPRRLGVLFDNKAAEAAAQKLVEEYGLVVDPAAVVREIGVGLQQRVEILKTLYRGADILILDEPTAVLTPQETEKLFTVMRNMKRTARRSSSSRTSCMRCLPSPTAWPFCARASTSAILTLPPLPSSR